MSLWLRLFFFQAEDGIRDLVRSRGLGDVYKRQVEVQPLEVLQLADRRHIGIDDVCLPHVEILQALLSLIHI